MFSIKRALAAFTCLWIVTCSTAFSTFGPPVVGGATRYDDARGGMSTPIPRTTKNKSSSRLPMMLPDLPSSILVSDLYSVPDTQLPWILFTVAFAVSIVEKARNVGITYTSIVGDDFQNIRQRYAEVVAQGPQRQESTAALFEVEDSFVDTEFTRQERLDLLAKAEYYDQEAVRARGGGGSSKKRSLIGRILKPWKK